MGRYPDDPLGVLNPVLRCWSFRVGPCIVEWLFGRTNVEIRTVLTALECIDHIVQSVPWCFVLWIRATDRYVGHVLPGRGTLERSDGKKLIPVKISKSDRNTLIVLQGESNGANG